MDGDLRWSRKSNALIGASSRVLSFCSTLVTSRASNSNPCGDVGNRNDEGSILQDMSEVPSHSASWAGGTQDGDGGLHLWMCARVGFFAVDS